MKGNGYNTNQTWTVALERVGCMIFFSQKILSGILQWGKIHRKTKLIYNTLLNRIHLIFEILRYSEIHQLEAENELG
jgi:hypothetical protein